MILSKRQLFCIHILNSRPHLTAKRASFCISSPLHRKTERGSITVETALVLPFFFLAIVCLFYMMEVMAIRTSIQSGIYYTAKQIAEETYVMPILRDSKLEESIVQAIGKERLDRSIIVQGSSGLHCEESRMSPVTGILEIKVNYEVRLPVPAISNITVPMEESLRMKSWCGYTRSILESDGNQTVYITENGMVYHTDIGCNYLQLSIQGVAAESVSGLRNQDQGIYHACKTCGAENARGTVYITEYGSRYHSSMNCSGLKRTVYAVPLKEAVGKGACAKCGK